MIEQSRGQAGIGPRLYLPSLKMRRRRYTRVCKVRLMQCVLSADWLQEPDISRTNPSFVVGCEAPSVPGVFGVYECVCVRCVRVCARAGACSCTCTDFTAKWEPAFLRQAGLRIRVQLFQRHALGGRFAAHLLKLRHQVAYQQLRPFPIALNHVFCTPPSIRPARKLRTDLSPRFSSPARKMRIVPICEKAAEVGEVGRL